MFKVNKLTGNLQWENEDGIPILSPAPRGSCLTRTHMCYPYGKSPGYPLHGYIRTGARAEGVVCDPSEKEGTRGYNRYDKVMGPTMFRQGVTEQIHRGQQHLFHDFTIVNMSEQPIPACFGMIFSFATCGEDYEIIDIAGMRGLRTQSGTVTLENLHKYDQYFFDTKDSDIAVDLHLVHTVDQRGEQAMLAPGGTIMGHVHLSHTPY